ncbi:MAG: thioredoxin domain-containing protein [Chloroflexi bacterium]|nr:thioredoxin domain-containing protein [Chloroflexota bacterium]
MSFIILAALAVGACAAETETPPTATPPIVVNPVIPNTPTLEYTCSRITAAPASTSNAASLFPPVSAADFSFGPADAPVTLIEYCDFQSQGCKAMASIAAELMKNRGDLRFVFRPPPLIGVLDKSEASVLAALAADEQGKFWEMYGLLFAKHSEWTSLSLSQFNAGC